MIPLTGAESGVPGAIPAHEASFLQRQALELMHLSDFPPTQPRAGEQEETVEPFGTILNRCRGSKGAHLVVLQEKALSLLGSLYGQDVLEAALQRVEHVLRRSANTFAPPPNPPAGLIRFEAGEYIVVWNVPEAASWIEDAAFVLRMALQKELQHLFVQSLGKQAHVRSGQASETCGRGRTWERTFYQALDAARSRCSATSNLENLSLMGEFELLVAGRTVEAHFQPIVSLVTGQTLGWEALSRGPEGSPFRSPQFMFDFAEESDSLFALERACRARAIAECGPLQKGQKLFLNIHPRTMLDPNFTPGQTKRLLANTGLAPEDVVFEITERHSVKDFGLFHKALDHYRSQGFKVAVDDAGAGYAGLWSIAQLRPDYIKVDMSLVQGVAHDPVRRALMETFVAFADKVGARVIAEGIENHTDLSSLTAMGVHCGQGFLFARPAAPRPEPANVMANLAAPVPKLHTGCRIPLANLVDPVMQVDQSASVEDVRLLMKEQKPLASVVVVYRECPVGLIMSHHLDRHLASRYGVALYSKRPVTNLMDGQALIVDENEAVERVAQLAMGRERFKAYDDIIVTRHGHLLGVVSVQQMIDAMAQAQVEMAKGANPLTGLPGNVALEQEIESRMARHDPTAIVYADLDNFKVYNDTYGFKQGDQVIQLLAKILVWAGKRHGAEGSFVGHIGGDDFVLLAHPDQVERICTGVVRCFGRAVRGYYTQQDRTQGCTRGVGRDGSVACFPLVAVSLGVVFCHGPCPMQVLSERAAEIKHYAKTYSGNNYVLDRRGVLGEG